MGEGAMFSFHHSFALLYRVVTLSPLGRWRDDAMEVREEKTSLLRLGNIASSLLLGANATMRMKWLNIMLSQFSLSGLEGGNAKCRYKHRIVGLAPLGEDTKKRYF